MKTLTSSRSNTGGINRVIAIDDNPDLRYLWKVLTDIHDIQVKIVDQFEATRLSSKDWKDADLLITDWMMEEFSGEYIIQKARKANPDIEVHVLTAAGVSIRDGMLPPRVTVWDKPTQLLTILREAGYAD